MLALAPFVTAIVSSIFIKEYPTRRMWITIGACFFSILFIFYDSYQGNRIIGDIFGLLTAFFIGSSAVVVRYSKFNDFIPALLIAKVFTFLIPIFKKIVCPVRLELTTHIRNLMIHKYVAIYKD